MSLSRKPVFTKSIGAAGVFAMLLLSPACTDLTEVPTSSIGAADFYGNETEVISGLASVYAQLRSTLDDYYDLSEISTDEMIVPTRGQDWYDNGQWIDVHRQTWTANSPAAGSLINGAWVNLFQGVARANIVLNAVNNGGLTFAAKPTVIAELRTLRAFYYYLLMDMFGGVPVVTDLAIMPRERPTRDSVFKFIEAELNAARPDLPVKWPAEMNGRITQGAVDAILASMYLNAQVFTGTVTTAGLQPGTARWQDAITASDRILNSSAPYSLESASTWRHNFSADNYSSPEVIFAVKFTDQGGLGLNFMMRVLHYTQYNGSPWNGFATLAETYNSFTSTDQRKQIFLEGQQFNLDNGLPVNDRSGQPLVFDPTIADITQATEGAGVRIVKWGYDPNHVAADAGNDFAHFRLGEIYLIKAEALNELGRTPEAVALVNVIRARAYSPAQPLDPAAFSQVTFRNQILSERLLELTAEGKRRQDLIRMNKYTQGTWAFKAPSPAYKILMPIPQTQLETNLLLKQNAGY